MSKAEQLFRTKCSMVGLSVLVARDSRKASRIGVGRMIGWYLEYHNVGTPNNWPLALQRLERLIAEKWSKQ